jgi:hypothetical protein
VLFSPFRSFERLLSAFNGELEMKSLNFEVKKWAIYLINQFGKPLNL